MVRIDAAETKYETNVVRIGFPKRVPGIREAHRIRKYSAGICVKVFGRSPGECPGAAAREDLWAAGAEAGQTAYERMIREVAIPEKRWRKGYEAFAFGVPASHEEK